VAGIKPSTRIKTRGRLIMTNEAVPKLQLLGKARQKEITGI
jgi:hypothetical protein